LFAHLAQQYYCYGKPGHKSPKCQMKNKIFKDK
jgi:hypothetical protein